MDPQLIIKTVCRYLELLSLKPNESRTPSSLKEAVLEDLATNLENVLNALQSENPFLYETLCSYVSRPSETNGASCHWNFVMACVVLIQGVIEALSSLEKQHEPTPSISATHEAQEPELLSISEQSILKKCFQFVVALGLLPNLILSIRNILRARILALSSVETIEEQLSPQVKYCRLVFCTSFLLNCLQQKSIREIISTQHTGDLLVSLLQLCYAPIMKLEDDKKQQETQLPLPESAGVYFMKKSFHSRYEDLDWMILRLRVCNEISDQDFIAQMWEDRKHFCCELDRFFSELSPGVLMWELLMLQGCVPADSGEVKAKMPMWLKTECNRILANKIMEPGGVKNLIKIAFDKMSDADVKAGNVTRHRVEAMARLIIGNPVKHVSYQEYAKRIAEQVIEMIHTKDTSSSQIFMSVISAIVLQLAEHSPELANLYISQVLFRTFWKCLSENTLIFAGEKIAEAEDVTACIENAHRIFVANASVLKEEQVAMLLPFVHLLFIMYSKLQNGISYLKSRVQDLLVVILNNCDSDSAIRILEMCVFEDVHVPGVHFAANIKCVFADDGCIEVIRCQDQARDDDDDDYLTETVDSSCQSVVKLLNEVSDKKLRVSFYLSVLKSSVRTYMSESQSEAAGGVRDFIFTLARVNLLENLWEMFCDDLANDIDKAIEVVKESLECVVNSPKQFFSQEAILNFVLILQTFMYEGKELTSAQWKALKGCLSSLDALISTYKDSFLGYISEEVSKAIRTHGSTLDGQQGALNDTAANHMTYSSGGSHLSAQSSKLFAARKEVLSNEKPCNSESVQVAGDGKESANHFTSKASGNKHIHSQQTMQPSYELALKDVDDSSVPSRGHGLISLCNLLEKQDAETLAHKKELLEIFKKCLHDDDSYIYLPSIRGLSALGNVCPDDVLPVLLSEFVSCKDKKWEYTLKIGESLLKICQKLGQLTPKYRDELLNAYLVGARHEDPHIRASSLSNLGEVCKEIKFAIGPCLQEILYCVTLLLKTDPSIEVKRSAVMVITLILRGAGVDALSILGNEIKELYSLLRWTFHSAKDDVLKLQAELAMAEVNHIVKQSFSPKPEMTKYIRVLDPF